VIFGAGVWLDGGIFSLKLCEIWLKNGVPFMLKISKFWDSGGFGAIFRILGTAKKPHPIPAPSSKLCSSLVTKLDNL
jgi:hypothetical protein